MRSEFVNILNKSLYVFSTNIISQIIPFLLIPVTAHLFSIKQFALQAIFLSTSSLLTSVGDFQYRFAILSEKNIENKYTAYYLSVLISISTSSVFYLLLSSLNYIVYPNIITNILKSNSLITIILYALINVNISSLSFLYNSFGNIKKVSNSRLINIISSSFFFVVLGFKKIDNGLIYGLFLGSLFQLSYLYNYKLIHHHKLQYKEIFSIFKKNKQLPLFLMPQSFVDSFRTNILIFLINTFYGSSLLGLYALSEKIIRVPLNIASSSMNDFFIKYVSDLYLEDKYKLHERLTKLLNKSLFIILSLSLLSFFCVEPIIRIFFDTKWEESISIIKSFFPLSFFWFVVSPISYLPILTKNQKYYLFYSSLMFTLSHLIFLLAGFFSCDFTIALFLKNSIEFIFLMYLSKKSINQIIDNI